MILSAAALLKSKSRPSEQEIVAFTQGEHLPLRNVSLHHRGGAAGKPYRPRGRRETRWGGVRTGAIRARVWPCVSLADGPPRAVSPSGRRITCTVGEAGTFQESGRRPRRESLPENISAWLHIGEGGKGSVYTGKVEVGQNARTSLTQAVAEELKVLPANMRLVMSDTNLKPFDMGTFGSRCGLFVPGER